MKIICVNLRDLRENLSNFEVRQLLLGGLLYRLLASSIQHPASRI